MNKPHQLQPREHKLIALYCQCELGMTPRQFYEKWEVTHEQMAEICDRSLSTVRGWFKRGRHYRHPTPTDVGHLALMNFLLEHFEEIPATLWKQLCPSLDSLPRNR
jgi:hypothetical protein